MLTALFMPGPLDKSHKLFIKTEKLVSSGEKEEMELKNKELRMAKGQNDVSFKSGLKSQNVDEVEAGLPDFSWTKQTKTEKYTK
jgi:hypothetical protein